MASKTDSIIVQYSTGSGNNLGKATAKSTSWLKFYNMFETPVRTTEKLKAYLALPNEQQQHLKGVAGWVHRAIFEGKSRNAADGKPSRIMSLDFDYATAEWFELLCAGLICPSFEFFFHTSRRHTPEKPRVRIWLLLDRAVTREEYGPLSRIIGQMFDPDMAMIDKVSFRKAQMMFLPTCSRDSKFVHDRNRGTPVPVDDIFDNFTDTVGDWRDLSLLPKVDGEELREHAEKAEVPTDKPGPVGDFCRAYSITDAMDKWIPGTYEESDHDSEKPRYSYLGGTTANGAVLEDDGLFLYSHHGSDPCADMLVNAWDMVRIHKFGDLDANVDKDMPMGKRPSWQAMLELVQDDPDYKRQQVASKYDMIAMMGDVMDDYIQDDDYVEPEVEDDPEIAALIGTVPSNESFDDQDEIDDLVGKPSKKKREADPVAALAADIPSPNRRKSRKPPTGWFPDKLEIDKQGNIIQNLPNAQTIIYNDYRLFDGIAYDEFLCRLVLLRDIKSEMETVPPLVCRDKVRGDIWQDGMDMTVRAILAGPNGPKKKGYGIDKLAERDLATAIYLTGMRNKFHPIKEFLSYACDEVGWDGTERVERLFIDYLGVPDTIYHRQTARMIMVASIARIMEPGCKFDFAPVLQGAQGIRKSSFIETLYGAEFFGELTCNLRDTQKIAEVIGGIWGMELPELSAMYKSDHNDAKQFLSAKVDKVRMAYDRRVSVFQRQAVFWGTTNDRKYLKDPTGNRRWWPIIIAVNQIDTDRLARERVQLWAEAMHIYREMRKAQPAGTLPLYLSDPEAQATAQALQTEARTEMVFEGWAEQIDSWADAPVTLRHFLEEHKMLNKADRMDDDSHLDETLVQRVVFLNNQAGEGALGFDRTITNAAIIQDIDRAISHLGHWKSEGGRKKRLGVQGRWKVRIDATDAELKVGYRVILDENADLV